MKKITVSIQETSNPKIIKFETNSFLTKYESFEFSNIDEAKNSPSQEEHSSSLMKQKILHHRWLEVKRAISLCPQQELQLSWS